MISKSHTRRLEHLGTLMKSCHLRTLLRSVATAAWRLYVASTGLNLQTRRSWYVARLNILRQWICECVEVTNRTSIRKTLP
jgi:hypothetical protein